MDTTRRAISSVAVAAGAVIFLRWGLSRNSDYQEGTLMESSAPNAQDLLMRECEEFQQLSRRHRELDARLSALAEKLILSDEEKVEEVTIKKKKLVIKDRMAFMIRSH